MYGDGGIYLIDYPNPLKQNFVKLEVNDWSVQIYLVTWNSLLSESNLLVLGDLTESVFTVITLSLN